MVGDFSEYWGRRLGFAIGGALMSAFGPSIVPQKFQPWLVALGFVIILLAIFWPLLERWPGRLLAQHVFWRFHLRPPSASEPARSSSEPTPQSNNPRNLTATDRERVSKLILDVSDFIGADLQPFRNELVTAICGRSPPALSALSKPIQDMQRKLSRAANELWHRHTHYLELIGLDILPILRGIEDLRNPIAEAFEAREWPQEAQQGRADALNHAFSQLGVDIEALKSELIAKRKEYLDPGPATEIPAPEEGGIQPKRVRLSGAERERVTDRLIKLDDYLAGDVATIIRPLRGLLDWQEHLRQVGAGQLNSEIEAMRQPIARRIKEAGKVLTAYQADTEVIALNPMAIKTKLVPVNNALRDFTDVTQALAETSIHWSPLVMPGRQLTNVVSALTDEIDRVRRDIAEWRKRIAQGELD
jgi:hypothetical protein